MNQRFLVLEEEKRKAVINSGFRNFALFGYRKASMRDIAEDAGVSKALLFHYFDTKKEFYLFLWSFVKVTIDPFLKLDGETIRRLYPETHFRKDIDLTLMFRDMYYMSEGYLWHWCQKDEFDVDRMEKDYLDFISQWKRIYTEQQ